MKLITVCTSLLTTVALTLTLGTDRAEASRALGIDSDFNCCTVNWSSVAGAGVQFACIKAAAKDEGFQNNVFANRMQGAHAAGIYTIPYYRCDPSAYEPQTEAAYFWAVAGSSIITGSHNLSPALDVEDGLTGTYLKDGGGTQSLAAWCNQWFADVKADAAASGVTIVQITYVNAGTTCAIGSGLHGSLWLANPCCMNDPQSGNPYTCGGCSESSAWDGCEPIGSESWSLWQYEWSSQQSSPPYPGLSERVDLNAYNGDISQMVSALQVIQPNNVCDFNGDYTTDFSTWRPSNFNWYIDGIEQVLWGGAGDIPVPGNYNGNGKAVLATWRPSNGKWYIDGGQQTVWGANGDIPVPGDYNGDGVTDLAVWRPANATWYVDGVEQVVFGTNGDIPVPGDYNGDGKTELAVWRPSNGTWYINGVGQFQWGQSGDVPVPGDYNGDGITEMAVWRPSNGTWYIYPQGTPLIQWGQSGDVPVPGDYNGDGKTVPALWRPSNNTWYVYPQGTLMVQWGAAGDIPLPLPYAIRHYSLGYSQ